MTLWWIGDAILLVVLLPVVVYLLHGVLQGRQEHRPERPADRPLRPRDRRTSTPAALLLTTKDQVAQTVEGVANYGGSLDIILDDAQ